MTRRKCFGTKECNPKQAICKHCNDLNHCINEVAKNHKKKEKDTALQYLQSIKKSTTVDSN